MEKPTLGEVVDLVQHGCVPFADIMRAIPHPSDVEHRSENDAEHSWMLSLVASSVAQQLGLDVGKVCEMAAVHDFVEVFAGDFSVWSTEPRELKAEREHAALETIGTKWRHFPWIKDIIKEYESLESEEACLVYTLDKLLAVIMITLGDGHFWKSQGITYDMHIKKVAEVRPRIAKHPAVLAWYNQLLAQIDTRQAELFAP